MCRIEGGLCKLFKFSTQFSDLRGRPGGLAAHLSRARRDCVRSSATYPRMGRAKVKRAAGGKTIVFIRFDTFWGIWGIWEVRRRVDLAVEARQGLGEGFLRHLP